MTGPHRVDLPPLVTKIWAAAVFVVVVVVAFAPHEEVDWQEILARILEFKVGVAKLVGKPIDHQRHAKGP